MGSTGIKSICMAVLTSTLLFSLSCNEKPTSSLSHERAGLSPNQNQDPEQKSKINSEFATQTQTNEIKVMTYNVYNLFDTEHDLGKEDYTHLPQGYPGKEAYCNSLTNNSYKRDCLETDWTQDKLEVKLGQIKKVVEAQGSLPDLLGIQEIENESVTRQLAQKLGYSQFLITDSPDLRGIDVALLYLEDKLSYLSHKEIVLKGGEFDIKPTRNILQVIFEAKGSGEKLAVYVNHWPSQASGPDKRVDTAQILKSEIQMLTQSEPGIHIVVMGDFNTLESEYPNAFHHVMEDPNWKDHFWDSQRLAKQEGNTLLERMPPNSYLYKSDWQKLDRILLSKNLHDKNSMEVLPMSFRIFSAPFLGKKFSIRKPGTFLDGNIETWPLRSDFNSLDPATAGYSDHLPVFVHFKI